MDVFILCMVQVVLDPSGISSPGSSPPPIPHPLYLTSHGESTQHEEHDCAAPPRAPMAGKAFPQQAETNGNMPSYFLHHFQVRDEQQAPRLQKAGFLSQISSADVLHQCKGLLYCGVQRPPVPLSALPSRFRKQMRNN